MKFSEFADLPIVDCHVHIHPSRISSEDDLEDEAETLKELIKGGYLTQIYISAGALGLYLKIKYPGLFYAGCPLPNPETSKKVNWNRYLNLMMEAGFDGVGEIVSKPAPRGERVPLDDPYYEGLWSTCESRGYAVLCHVADPEEFWDERLIPNWAKERGWAYYGDDYPSKEELYSEMENVLDDHPKLKIVLCHFYFMSANLEGLSRFLDSHKNANLDLALGIELIHNISKRRDDWRAFFIRYCDRILFGTDIGVSRTLQQHLDRVWLIRNFLESDEEFYTPSTADWLLTRYREPFRGLNLPNHVLKKIYSTNFRRLWGAEPRSVKVDLAASVCEETDDKLATSLLKTMRGL